MWSETINELDAGVAKYDCRSEPNPHETKTAIVGGNMTDHEPTKDDKLQIMYSRTLSLLFLKFAHPLFTS